MNQRYELAHEVVWDGTRSGPVGSPSANRHLLFWEPAYAKEEPGPRVVVRKSSGPGLSRGPERQASVLAAMGAEWTRPCMVARRIGLSSDQAWLTLHGLVDAGLVEVKNMAPSMFSRGVLWYRRVRESSQSET